MLTASTAWIIFFMQLEKALGTDDTQLFRISPGFSTLFGARGSGTWSLKSILNRQKRDRRGLMTVMTACYFKFLQRAPNYVWRMGEWNR